MYPQIANSSDSKILFVIFAQPVLLVFFCKAHYIISIQCFVQKNWKLDFAFRHGLVNIWHEAEQ